MAQFNFKAIGTTWRIDIFKPLSDVQSRDLLSKINARIEIFDKTYSRFREDSLVTQMSRTVGTYVLPEDAKPMLSLYQDLYMRTGGLVTPLIGNLISDAGYDAKYSLKQKGDLKPSPKWEDVLDCQQSGDETRLIIKKPVLLDFGAAGKGYLIDIVANLLEQNGVAEYCIDAGGDILHKGSIPTRVGLENPQNFKEVIGIYPLQNKSICGSAGNRRAWGNFTHIINPKTLTSPRDILAVWVVADSAMIADGLTTCLFFVDPATLTDGYKFEYLIVRSDHSIEKPNGFEGEMFM